MEKRVDVWMERPDLNLISANFKLGDLGQSFTSGGRGEVSSCTGVGGGEG